MTQEKAEALYIMESNTQRNQRIAKNTVLLYIRTAFTMLVSLFTSRIILNVLGVDNYGIYNVVGGTISMFSIISGSLSGAISRFITFGLGEGDLEKLKRIFSTSVNIQIGLSVVIFILAEIGGLWFLNAKLNIPPDRMYAAHWVLQFSILTFILGLISTPYNACIIAHERMSAFAYISILEAVGKLAIALLITMLTTDKLILYAILMCTIAFIIRMTYGAYCKKHFEECTFHFVFDKELLRRMFSFAGWNFIGATATILRDQGGNIVINLFCGPAVNAARGIAFQVNTAIHGFITNFMTALNPQITKSYASGDKNYMMSLILHGARLSFYMLLFLSLPVLVNTHYILMLWLKIVPEHSVTFVRLVLILGMCEAISNPLITAMLATGNIRKYQIIVGSLNMMNLPISYILLFMGMYPEAVFIVAIILSISCLAARILLLRGMIGLSGKDFLIKVCVNVIIVTAFSTIFPIWLATQLSESFSSFVYLTMSSFVCTGIVIYYVGLNKAERQFAKDKVNRIIKKIK